MPLIGSSKYIVMVHGRTKSLFVYSTYFLELKVKVAFNVVFIQITPTCVGKTSKQLVA